MIFLNGNCKLKQVVVCLNYLLRILSVLVSYILFFSSCPKSDYKPLDNDSLVLSAVVLSDVHIETNNFDRFPRLGKMMNGIYSSDFVPDVLAFCGDSLMNGQELEWLDFCGFVNRYNRGSRVVMACGNHELGNNASHDDYIKLSKRFIKNYNRYFDGDIDSLYYVIKEKGYRFIVLGSDDNAEKTVEVISDEQIEWLKIQLAECREKGIPAFVFNHNLIYGKNGNRSLWDFNLTDNDKQLDAALKNCGTKVIYFCGHSHFGINEGSVYSENNVTYINLPTSGNSNYDSEGINEEYGNGLFMEVYEDKIELRFRNFIKNEWIRDYGSYTLIL